jgi:cyclase
MLKKRIIPTLLLKDVGLVKGVAFDSWRRVGSVLPSINVYNTRDVDELILLDIMATNEKRTIDYDSITEYSEECTVPFTVGGGVDNINKIRKLLLAGADKVVINSHSYEDPNLVKNAANRFGSQCIVSSIDVKKNANGVYECFSHCGTKPTGREVVVWAKEVELLGAGEIIITSIELDGTMKGYDCILIKKITENVNIPVIASGGAGEYNHFYEAIHKSNASAVAAASVFHFTEITPAKIKQYLSKKGMPVRDINAK